MKKIIILAAIIALIPALTLAFDKPSSKETKKVMEYYNSGKGNGALLFDYKLCTKVGEEGENKNECVQSISGDEIKVGDEIHLWMNFISYPEFYKICAGNYQNWMIPARKLVPENALLCLKAAFRV
ncbi:MAG: hypothetical protein ABIJ59_08565 [Pseudomonadota bacterium]